MKTPSDKEEWQKIIDQTNSRWQFPNCYAAADGKHVGVICPPHSGSEFYNYKGIYSILLLAFVDYDYKFLVAEVGCQGRISDGGVYRNSSFYSALKENKLNLPDPQPLPQSSDPYWEFHQDNDEMPIVFVGDDVFPLSDHCMKPYGLKNASDMERVYRYRLSRFRKISENGFGIWSKRFRLFSTRALLTPGKAVIAIIASLALHNMLRTKSSESYTPTGLVDFEIPNGNVIQGEWRECLTPNLAPLQCGNGGRQSLSGKQVRQKLCNYVNGPGQVPWQWKVLVK